MSTSSFDDADDDDDGGWAVFFFRAIFVFFFTGDESEFDDDCIDRFEWFNDMVRVGRVQTYSNGSDG